MISDRGLAGHSDIYLGIDLGTTSVKAALIDGGGARLAHFGQSYPIHRPAPGFAEQDADDWTTFH